MEERWRMEGEDLLREVKEAIVEGGRGKREKGKVFLKYNQNSSMQ